MVTMISGPTFGPTFGRIYRARSVSSTYAQASGRPVRRKWRATKIRFPVPRVPRRRMFVG